VSAFTLTDSSLNVRQVDDILVSLLPQTCERLLEVVRCFNEKRFVNLVLGVLWLENDRNSGTFASGNASAKLVAAVRNRIGVKWDTYQRSR
jgi:hypothetical protein